MEIGSITRQGYDIKKCYKLTPTQIRVLIEIANGLSDKEIAAKFHNSKYTIETHARTILQRLGCQSRMIAVRMFLEFIKDYDPEKLLPNKLYDVYEAHKMKDFSHLGMTREHIASYTHQLKSICII